MNEWRIKSESDTDIVLAEYDRKGRETGNYRYAGRDGQVVNELHVPGLMRRARRWPWALAGAGLVAAVEIIRAIV